MRRIKVAVAAFGLLAASAGAVATAEASSSGGKLYVFVSGNSFNTQKVLLAGAIGDYGSGISVTASGKPSQNGNFERLRLHRGSILVDSTKFNAAGNHPRTIVMSSSTCTAVFSWTGPVTIVSGTGAYAGISGRLNMKGTFAGITPRNKSGKHKGQCTPGNSVQPLALSLSITGSGNIKL